MARQRMGQHFLAGEAWQQRIFATLPHNPDDVWVEIGAGHGEMTQLLASAGSRVIAIEADPTLAEGLARRIRAHRDEFPRTEVVAGDILGLHPGELAGGIYRVYGNLPYYITSPILHRLFEDAARIASIHTVMQLEVAQRIVARPGNREYGYLSVACQFYTRPEIVLRIPPGAFRPPPKVTSALVRMSLPGGSAALGLKDEAGFLNFVKLCFAQKRKVLRNNLRTLGSDRHIRETIAAAGINDEVRAEELSIAQLAALFQLLAGKVV